MNANTTFNIKITHIELKDNQIILTACMVGIAFAADAAMDAPIPESLIFHPADGGADYIVDGPDAITVQEASKILNCGETTIENMRKDGRLRSYYRGRSVRLRRQEVMDARTWWSVAKGKV